MHFGYLYDEINKEIYIQQLRQEAVTLASVIRSYLKNVSVIMEIGLREGGNLTFLSTALFTQFTESIAIGIEPEWEMPFDAQKVAKQIAPATFHHIKADSHLLTTRQQVMDILAGRMIDVLVLDGDHTRAGVQLDDEMYSPFLSRPGVKVVHDINMSKYVVKGVDYGLEQRDTVVGYWKDVLSKQYPNVAISAASDLCGIGVVLL